MARTGSVYMKIPNVWEFKKPPGWEAERENMDKINLDNYDVRFNPAKEAYTVTTVEPAGSYEIDLHNYSEYIERYEQEEKSRVVMMVLWLVLGVLGFHRFYIGDMKKGVLLLFTGGGFIIGWLIDFAFICPRVTEYNEDLKKRLLEQAILKTQKDKERQAKLPLEKAAV